MLRIFFLMHYLNHYGLQGGVLIDASLMVIMLLMTFELK